MRDYQLTIPNGESRSVSVPPSNFLRIKTAVSEARYRFEAVGGGAEIASLLLSEGNRATLDRDFSLLRVENNSGASLTVEVVIGRGAVDDSSISGSVSVSNNVTLENPHAGASGNTSVPNAVKTLITTPPTNSIGVFISNPSTSAGPIWVGNTSVVSVGVGVEIMPGGTLFMPGDITVYCYQATGAAVLVGFHQVRP